MSMLASGKLLWKYEPTIDMQIAEKALAATTSTVASRSGGWSALRRRLYALMLPGRGGLEGRHRCRPDLRLPRPGEVAGDVVVIERRGGAMAAGGHHTAYDRRAKQAGASSSSYNRKLLESPEMAMAAKTLGRHARAPGASRRRRARGGTGWSMTRHSALLYVATGNANSILRARRSPSGGDTAASVLAIDPKIGTAGLALPGDARRLRTTTRRTHGPYRSCSRRASNGLCWITRREERLLLLADFQHQGLLRWRNAPRAWADHNIDEGYRPTGGERGRRGSCS